ncbi:GGDEF domain-containing protein [Mangrovimicrobium sediminis]|nr:GGDEF domain-containing protein [Haliea sp. SAOS-164]
MQVSIGVLISVGVAFLLLGGTAGWLLFALMQQRKLAHTDYLTGIANRGSVFEQGFKLVEHAHGEVEPFSIVLFDVDHFKKINDTLGHGAGDRALRVIVNASRRVLGQREFLGRLGGEEFIAVLPGCGREEAMKRAESLRLAIARAGFLYADKHPVNMTASLGVATLDRDVDFQILVNRADEALYVAKNSGRNRAVRASSSAERLSAGMVTVGSRQRVRG